MRPEHLLDIADNLARGSGRPGRPRRADLARAVSTAYYAVFHALANCCANRLAGATPASRSRRRRAWRQTYTSPEHRTVRSRCENRNVIQRFPEDIREFAKFFAILQREREAADYEPDMPYSRYRAAQLVQVARQAVRYLDSADASDQLAFALYVLMKERGR